MSWKVPALIAAGFGVLHLALALTLAPVDDETYYALWAAHPAWGYFDHPPMIAWWIAAGKMLLGEGLAGLRLLPAVAFAAVTLLAARMAFLLAGDAAAARAALYVNATVPFLALGFVATPDAPSVLFWTAATWALLEYQRSGKPGWWLCAGLCAGLGVQSKLTGLFLGVGLVLWLLLDARGRLQLRRPWPWAGGALALLAMTPLLLWNAGNDWVGFERQFGRIGEAPPASPVGLLAYLAETALLVTPLILWLALRGFRDAGTRLLIWLNAPLLVYLGWHSLGASVPGNWLMPVYPALAVLAAVGAGHATPRLRRAAPVLGLALGAAALAVVLWPGRPILAEGAAPNQMRGWEPVRAEIDRKARELGAGFFLAADYGLTGRLWWELGAVWTVRPADEPRRYLFLPPPSAETCTAPALLVARRPVPPRPGDQEAGTTARESGGRTLAIYHLVLRPGPHDIPGCPPA